MERMTCGNFYRRIGVRQFINAASWITVAGGSLMREPVLKAMEDASHWFVDMHELNRQAGKVIAQFTNAEAAFVTAGASAGLMLQAAGVMTGKDMAKVWQLPDATGMKNEIIIHIINMGADMVTFSGGKGLRGPQSTGILCGRKDLIEAAYMSASPNGVAIGRMAKVCKEEIAGLITALELFVKADHRAIVAEWRAKCEHVVSALADIPGVKPELREAVPERDEADSLYPRAVIHFDSSWTGPREADVIHQLKEGDPAIWVRNADYRSGIAIIPVNLQDGEEEIVIRRLRQILTGKA